MALFIDGPIASLTDLKAYENAVLDIASLEKVDVAAKLRIAQREIGIEISNFLLRQGMHPGSVQELSNVVTTEQMLHVHALHALALVYRDAYNGQPNDTYKTKWREYAQLAGQSLKRLFDTGIGIAINPLPRPALPSPGSVAGGVLPARYYFVAIAWVGTSGARGAWSSSSALALEPGTLLSITASTPAGVSGWLVSAGTTEDDMRLQTPVALEPGETWIEPVAGLRLDLPNRPEQTPDYYVANRRLLLRG